MAKRRKKASGGVPEWVVTYGDMMSLLLCFFILLAAFSELRRDHEYQRVITAVKEAFGYSGGVGVLPVDDPPVRSMIESLEEIAKKQMSESRVSHSMDQAITGSQPQVTKIHEGLMFTIGGHLTFEPESAVLLEAAKPEILKVANLLGGRNNKISIRGHAASKSLSPGSQYSDLWDLSYHRAKAIKEFLVKEGDIREQVLVIEARADNEPLTARAYTPEAQTQNRRVEIILTEAMVDDLHPDASYAREDLARGGGR